MQSFFLNSFRILTVISVIFLPTYSNAKLETPAYLSVKFYDKLGNEITSAQIRFYEGKRLIDRSFEYENEFNAVNTCNRKIKTITSDKKFFNASYYGARLFYAEKETSNLKDFNRIYKLKFECHVESDVANDQCLSDQLKGIIQRKISEKIVVSKLSENETNKLREEMEAEFYFMTSMGLCNYRILNESKYFFIDDLLK
jgi:hypothetical protein